MTSPLSNPFRGILSVLLLVVGCGSVTAQSVDAGGDASGVAGSSGAAGTDAGAAELAPEVAGAAGTTAAVVDAGDAQGEKAVAVAKCSGAMTYAFSGDMGVASNVWCKNYQPGLRCVTRCQDETGLEHPSLIERMESSFCQASGLPRFNGTLICATACDACPATPPAL